MLTNAMLRQRFGMDPSYSNDSDLTRQIKSVMGRVIGKTSFAPDTTELDMVTFGIDSKIKDFIVDLEPFERNF